ncbi:MULTISPECIES: D-tagatose-bisphosphate aldolase, class II, non-catalytic subunit [unclassified Duganella]|jgi:D-tagatose-1,6-bisphosphate aldolase subunit GatZ/KbaZ|uniref:D-tagatose-bisphosphate aldolase, class II, non-catalytic subunit n=1 Tax=unclassified Duganella TaxID=2636909 RepID=UPI00088568ED|nr:MULTISPECIES: D-tagatose-bisphosphate aldolase, class II, non-catalytic subunit [unclassified Duganella]SDG38768.1 D-tagatose-1,6-bisphosphate aldolase subunit GatZ/KbaZ [Duganella sp. OV458]SDJ64990.1 tagatose-bisphosphate aldolase noncatalytic subunit [Duganella sp. OV510]
MDYLLNLVRRHKAGEPVGIHSVCSAHPLVIEAAMETALERGLPVLIESTSNQVNQDGGYTGMTPAVFRDFVYGIADRSGLARERVLLGGDHLGPNAWQGQSADAAMAKAEVLIDQYVRAGFRKIHLDCSMSCAGDPVPLPDAVVAERAARLCVVAERAWSAVGGEAPVYVVGTEVPVPGGAHEDLEELSVTTPGAAGLTIKVHRLAFAAAGLEAAWPRVIGLVVQPGVEFDHHKVIDFQPQRAAELSRFIENEPTLVYEAHSTDYQTPSNLAALVAGHFAILKVGPGLTFALRETLWALADIEQEMNMGMGGQGSDFKNVVLEVMRTEPEYWRKYYDNDPARARFDQQYSLSDRIRYYWPHAAIQAAQAQLLANLERTPPPLTLLSQYLPAQYEAVREGRVRNLPADLLKEGVAKVLRQYMDACAGAATKELETC